MSSLTITTCVCWGLGEVGMLYPFVGTRVCECGWGKGERVRVEGEEGGCDVLRMSGENGSVTRRNTSLDQLVNETNVAAANGSTLQKRRPHSITYFSPASLGNPFAGTHSINRQRQLQILKGGPSKEGIAGPFGGNDETERNTLTLEFKIQDYFIISSEKLKRG